MNIAGCRRLFGTNGIRGVPGEDLNLDFVVEVCQSIATYFDKGTILLGYDGRFSSPILAKAASAGLMAGGVDVAEADLLPTPALQFGVRKLGYDGGVMITASHNPPEYNGIKVVDRYGVEISREDELKIEEIYYSKRYRTADWRTVGTWVSEARVVRTYIEGVLSHVDIESIRSRAFKVVIDPGNGVQSLAAPYILEELGCKVLSINANIDGNFSGRGAEPTPSTLTNLSQAIVASDASLGAGYDGDGDRSIFGDETGVIHWGDRTGAVLTDYILSENPGSLVVTTVSTTQLIDDVAERYGSKVIRTKVGSVDVSRAMIKSGALFGLEENGGFFYAPHNPVRDGAMTTALLLEAMAKRDRGLSEMVSELPQYYQRKTKYPCPLEKRDYVMKVIEENSRGDIDRTDGVKMWIDRHTWILLRPSGTEPIIRVFGESDKKEKLDDLMKIFSNIVEDALKK